MFATLTGVLLGVLVGVRHAFEPDHLAAVSTLVTDARSAGRGALLGAIWGVGHTLALVIVGAALLAAGALVPPGLEAAFELAVALMLVGLGARAVVRAWRDGARGPLRAHDHGGDRHVHAAAAGGHVHLGRWTLAWRPLAVGLVHGLAGSGAVTALVFAELASDAARVAYIALFGAGSIAGMALASGLAGASLARLSLRDAHLRRLAIVTGVLSIVVGFAWGLPLIGALA